MVQQSDSSYRARMILMQTNISNRVHRLMEKRLAECGL